MKSQNKLRIVVLLVGILAAASLLFQGVPARAQTTADDGDQLRTVSVSGLGQTAVTPDVAVARLGVTTEAETAQSALTENSQSMQTLLAALADLDVAEEDIQTQTVQLYPRYSNNQDEPGSPSEIVGYTATNIVEVRVLDLDRLGEILDSAVGAGSNSVEGIRFEIADASASYQEAMQAAMQDARTKAEYLAGLAGGQLGEVVSIVEGSQAAAPFGGGLDRVAVEQSVPIAPGTQNVSAAIRVTWQFIPGGQIPITGATPTAARTRLAVTPTSASTAVSTSTSAAPDNTPTASSTAGLTPTADSTAVSTAAATATAGSTAVSTVAASPTVDSTAISTAEATPTADSTAAPAP